MASFKLGKQRASRRLSTPAFGNFLPAIHHWPAVRPRGWEYAPVPIVLDCLGNDEVGNCVIAMAMHDAQNETANTGNPLTPTKQLALMTYSTITGYDPKQTDAQGNNPTDQGTDIEGQLMPFWKNTGIPMLDRNGKEVLHTIEGWASLDLSSVAQQRYACDVFGGISVGIRCPQSAMENTSNWTVVPRAKILGGHGVNMVGQGSQGWHMNSWGLLIPGDWGFSHAYADEMHVVVTKQWLNEQNESPSGLDLNGLLATMKSL